LKYASRAGYKLEGALAFFDVSPEGKVCLDIGASTGGFTDCLLQRGARKVFAVDVGTHQLIWRLRQDHRVISLEKTNARYLRFEQIGEHVDLTTIDVSFISANLVLPAVPQFLRPGGGVLV
jgi:23S rRNA (cytidine1920-2'-O)/16S rRNA (cytidine1409-2'-O)-methyltransferase